MAQVVIRTTRVGNNVDIKILEILPKGQKKVIGTTTSTVENVVTATESLLDQVNPQS